jgi:TonB family protein
LQQTLMTVKSRFGLSTRDTGPFHLKAHFDTFGIDGKLDGSGTLEEYWDGKERLRRELVYRGATMTIWRTPKEFRKGGTLHSAYFMRRLVRGFEDAIPQAQVLEMRAFTENQSTLGSVPMHCILTRSKPAPPPQNLPPDWPYGPTDEQAYCLSNEDRFLRVEQSFPDEVLVFNKLHPFGSKAVPYEIRLTQSDLQRGSFEVDTLDTWTPEDSVLVPPADAVATAPAGDRSIGVPGNLIAGRIISQPRPVYPPIAKAGHVQGSVILGALITKQGTIDDLEVLISRAPSLNDAAVEAVKQWRFRPFLLNGEPVAVDTTIVVTFAFGVGPGS